MYQNIPACKLYVLENFHWLISFQLHQFSPELSTGQRLHACSRTNALAHERTRDPRARTHTSSHETLARARCKYSRVLTLASAYSVMRINDRVCNTYRATVSSPLLDEGLLGFTILLEAGFCPCIDSSSLSWHFSEVSSATQSVEGKVDCKAWCVARLVKKGVASPFSLQTQPPLLHQSRSWHAATDLSEGGLSNCSCLSFLSVQCFSLNLNVQGFASRVHICGLDRSSFYA